MIDAIIKPIIRGFRAHIQVDPEILRVDIELKKVVLAEAWLHVMLGIQNAKVEVNRTTKDKFGLIEMYSKLGRDVVWGSDSFEQIERRIGLQKLLLPDETIRQFVKERYQRSIESIRTEAEGSTSNANRASTLIRSIERSLAADLYLKPELVRLRLSQVILGEHF